EAWHRRDGSDVRPRPSRSRAKAGRSRRPPLLTGTVRGGRGAVLARLDDCATGAWPTGSRDGSRRQATGYDLSSSRPQQGSRRAPGTRWSAVKSRSTHAVRCVRTAVFAAIGAIAWLSTALAGGPVAVVEEISGQPTGVDFMDYVELGKVIKLGPRDRIVLDYLKSCWRETITGGTVTVGAEQSRVQLGSVERVHIKCDGGRMELSPEVSVESAGLISRSLEQQRDGKTKTSPQITLYARTPLFDVRAGDMLSIE